MDQLFQALVENAADAITMLNADGTIRFSSESSVRMLGYTVDERHGSSGFDYLHPDDLERARALFTKCLAQPGAPLSIVVRMQHKNASWRVIEAVVVNRLEEPEIGAIVVNYRDVTDKVDAEAALRATDDRLRHIVEHAQDLIYYCDYEGRFTFVNPAAARVMEYAEQELLGRHFLTLIRDDYKPAAAEFYRRQMKDRIDDTYFEFPSVTRSGIVVWVGQHVHLVREGNRIQGVHAIARDITRQKQIEEELRASEARYRSLIQGAAYGIYRTTIDGQILDANPALAQMLGYDSLEELMALNIADVYKPASQRAAVIERYQRENNAYMSTDATWQRRDGSMITVRLTARIAEFHDGGRYFEGMAEDITEKRALEEQLRQAQKMEAVGRLARGIAHDFNNVLAAILGSSDLLMMRLKAGHPAREDAEEIQKASERGAALTKQLLAFSRSQAFEPRVLDLNAVMRGTIALLQRLAGPEVVLRASTGIAPVRVRVEAGQLEQVLINLVVNARDAMPRGGQVDVEIDPVMLDVRAAARYPPIPAGPYARIAVRDTGHGIDPEMAPHVFEPFFTTKDPSKGTGLGLSIVYGIAKDCGGTVAFSSKAGEGTIFEVMLPLIEEDDA